MRFSEIREEMYAHSGKASELIRQFAFAGLAVVWIFKEGEKVPIVPRAMIPSAIAFLLSLVADLAQYAILTRSWQLTAAKADKAFGLARNADPTLDPEVFDFPVRGGVSKFGNASFWVKMALVTGGYVALIAGISTKWGSASIP